MLWIEHLERTRDPLRAEPPFYSHRPDDAPPPRRCPPKPDAPLPDVADLCPMHRECRVRLGLPVARYCGHTGLRLEDGRPAWMGCSRTEMMEEPDER